MGVNSMLLKYPRWLTALLLVAFLICGNCVPAAYAVGPDAEPEVMDAEIVEETEPAIEEVTEEEEPVIDEIPDDLYQSYVLGCLTFFVVVIVFYFSYKFIVMFF